MPRNHSTIDVGASSSGRWTECTASPQFIVEHAAELPVDRSEFADEGSTAHLMAAAILEGKDPMGVATDGNLPKPTEAMLQHVRVYTDHVLAQTDPHRIKAVLHVEQAVSLFYLPHRNGIVDAAVILPEVIYINDLKYGQGVSVEAEGNTQLAIYAESLIQSWEQISEVADTTKVVMSIVQPRDRNNPVAVRTWTLTRAELRAFGEGIAAKAKEALNFKGVFKVTEKGCQFCPAKGLCSAYATTGLQALPPEAKIIELPHPGKLTRAQRVEVLKAKKILNKWLEAVEDQEVHDLMTGSEPAGLKLVEGKTNRQWSDEDAAMKLLSNHLSMDEMCPRSPVISPAAAEKALKGIELSTRFKNKMTSLITRPEGKPTLVLADDPRPALSFQQPDNGLKSLD